MDYAMEDTQNSAPGSIPAAQAAKLAPRKGGDAQSTTKRFVSPLRLRVVKEANLPPQAYKPS